MGGSCRTPSPSRGAHSLSDNDYQSRQVPGLTGLVMAAVSPEVNSTSAPPGALSAPQTPTTPIARARIANVQGLLTPSTPGFGNVFLESPIFHTGPGKRKECTLAATQVLYGGDDNTSGEILVHGNVDALESELEPRGKGDEAILATHKHSDFGVDEDHERDSNGSMQTHFDQLKQQIRDAEMAVKLAKEQVTTSGTGTRRSMRIASKETVKAANTELVEVTVDSPQTPKQIPIDRPTSAPESSLAEEAVVQLCPDTNPAPFTLDWNLQYPPGGSTHPSYAYPQLDPRLLFNPSFVPIVDGLPTVFAVPPLSLPMGWRHISWSGYLPIAFDPFHQAFKLTPIGPLPLTCEEVQQGGLAKFVPGGECHPEVGLLPDATAFSDGSDDERYNFDGVDWVLPWPQGQVFGASATTSGVGHREIGSFVNTNGLSASSSTAPSFYFEDRDCPDGIVDLEEGWRWLAHKETNPSAPFVRSTTKTWHGTGIHRAQKKFKTPIPSLMAQTIGELLKAPEDVLSGYLINQNAGKANGLFCPFRSVATPVHINITLLQDIELTIVELLSYFPNIYMWRGAADRFVRAGLSAGDVANFINWSRGLEGDSAKSSSSVNDCIWWEYEPAGDGTRKKIKVFREAKDEKAVLYTTEAWAYNIWEMTDYPLLGLVHGLKHVPEGPDAGPLTLMIQWCRDQGRYNTLLSDVPRLLEDAGVQPLIDAGENGDPDIEVAGRYAETLRKDRQRVLKAAREKKRTREIAEEQVNKIKEKRLKTE